jgi:hypothetical protein
MASRPRVGASGKASAATRAAGKNPAALLVAALNEPVYVTSDRKRHKMIKQEAIVTQLGNKSAGADVRATKMLTAIRWKLWQRRQ